MFGKGYVSVPHLFHNMIGTCHARQFPGAGEEKKTEALEEMHLQPQAMKGPFINSWY